MREVAGWNGKFADVVDNGIKCPRSSLISGSKNFCPHIFMAKANLPGIKLSE